MKGPCEGAFFLSAVSGEVILLRLFDYTEERAIAHDFATQLAKQLPVASLSGDAMGKISVNKITRSLEQQYQEVARKLKGKKIGIIRRSILANSLKWELKEKGYASDFIDVATEGLVMAMVKTPK